MLELKRLDRDPPKGWVFECWDGFVVREGYFQALVKSVKQHYAVNSKEVPDELEAIIQDQICMRIPHSLCKGDGPPRFWPTASQIVSGTRVLCDMFRGAEMVDQDEANRRAKICLNCEYNTRMEACLGCSLAYQLVKRVFGSFSTPHDKKLHVCRICFCLNKAQIHSSASTLKKATSKKLIDKYPDSSRCWKKGVLETP